MVPTATVTKRLMVPTKSRQSTQMVKFSANMATSTTKASSELSNMELVDEVSNRLETKFKYHHQPWKSTMTTPGRWAPTKKTMGSTERTPASTTRTRITPNRSQGIPSPSTDNLLLNRNLFITPDPLTDLQFTNPSRAINPRLGRRLALIISPVPISQIITTLLHHLRILTITLSKDIRLLMWTWTVEAIPLIIGNKIG